MSNTANNDRLAIVKDGIDVLRIIPSHKEDGRFDFKLAFINCDCEVYAYQLMHINPLTAIIDDARNASITYHHGEGGKRVVIHVKKNNAKPNETKYRSLPLANVAPPSEDVLAPLPLVKVEFPPNLAERAKAADTRGGIRTGKRKGKGRLVFDVADNCACIEVFMLPEGKTISDMITTFPGLSHALITLPFETWSSADLAINDSKRAISAPSIKQDVMREAKLCDIDLLVVQFPEPFMPLPPERLRLTFIDNALAEPIMLHTQVVGDVQNNRVFVRPPSEDTVRLPDAIRVKNPQDFGLWLDALRNGRIESTELPEISNRVNDGRKKLAKSLKDAQAAWKLRAKDISDTLRKSELFNIQPARSEESSLDRHVALAQLLGAIPTILHVTHISSESREVDEDYAFISLADDIDIHLDLPRLCALVGAPVGDAVCKTEGRPFNEGLAGMRTALQMKGFMCSDTSTYLLRLSLADNAKDKVELVHLYTMPSVSGLSWQPHANRWAEQLIIPDSINADDTEGFSLADYKDSGLYLFDITPGKRVAEGVPAKLAIKPKGAIAEDDWRELLTAMSSVARPHSAIRHASLVLDRALETMRKACSVEAVNERVENGEAAADVLADANYATMCFAVAYAAFAARLAQWNASDDVTRRALDEDPKSAKSDVGSFWQDMQSYACTTAALFDCISQTAGIGFYLVCHKGRLLKDDCTQFKRETRLFIKKWPGDTLDLLAIAESAVQYAHNALMLATLSHIRELNHAGRLLRQMIERHGIVGHAACLRVGKNGISPSCLMFETLPETEFFAAAAEVWPFIGA